MNRLFIIAPIAAIVLAGTYFFFFYKEHVPAYEITNYPSKGTNIIAFGDSLIAGNGSTGENDLVSVLSKIIGEPIINEGVPGNTTEDARKRIGAITEHDPKVVIVLLGGNDALRKVPPDTTFKNLEDIIYEIQNKGAVVLLIGIQGGILSDPYAEKFDELARTYKTAFIPNILDDIFGRAEYMADSVHPNNKGYEKIAEKIAPVLQDIIK